MFLKLFLKQNVRPACRVSFISVTLEDKKQLLSKEQKQPKELR